MPIPDDWNPKVAVALLLYGMSASDGEVDPAEIGTIRDRLSAYDDDPAGTLKRAAAHFHFAQGKGIDAVNELIFEQVDYLADKLGRLGRRKVMDDLRAVAASDSEFSPWEKKFIQAAADEWEM